MSVLLSKIEKERLVARKNKDILRASFLTTLLGEASPSGNDTVTEDDVMKVVKKFYKNLCDNRKIYEERQEDTKHVDAEIAVVLEFLPKQLSASEIEVIAKKVIEDKGIDSMKGVGQIMGYFSKNYEGQYNGKDVNVVVKSILMA